MTRTPTTAKTQRTVARILDGALELFNREGTAAVTTNHIAAHIGLSPGNLYYWFPDKQAIIRALWHRFVTAHDALWPQSEPPLPAEVLERFRTAAELNRRYLFLSRDMLSLVHADPPLRDEYAATRDRRRAAFVSLARAWRSAGLVRDVNDDRLRQVVDVLWIVSETWVPFAELDGAPDLAEGTELLRAVLEPYLTEEQP